MARSFMWWVLAAVFVGVDLWATFVWLPTRYAAASVQPAAPPVTVAATSPPPASAVGVSEVDQVILRKLERGELSCVNGYVSALRMENGTARAYVIQTDKGPARCMTKNRRGVQTSL